jgi:hypothetical protein
MDSPAHVTPAAMRPEAPASGTDGTAERERQREGDQGAGKTRHVIAAGLLHLGEDLLERVGDPSHMTDPQPDEDATCGAGHEREEGTRDHASETIPDEGRGEVRGPEDEADDEAHHQSGHQRDGHHAHREPGPVAGPEGPSGGIAHETTGTIVLIGSLVPIGPLSGHVAPVLAASARFPRF